MQTNTQTVIIPEQEYLQMKQTIQALQQQLTLLQDKEFMQFIQVFMLENQGVTQKNKTEQEKPLPFKFGAAKGLMKSSEDFNKPLTEFNEYTQSKTSTEKLKSLEQFKGGLANYQDITTTKTEWY
jgi:hypothetical protein